MGHAREQERKANDGANIRADFIEGMGKIKGKFVVILNIHQVLSVEEMATLAGVVGGEARTQ